MDVKTKVSLYTTTPDGYKTMDCKAIDYSASENALTIECQEIQQLIDRVARLVSQLARTEAECERLLEVLTNIGNYAHDASTGPTVPDAFWEIRKMAYEALADNTSQVAAGAAQRCNEL